MQKLRNLALTALIFIVLISAYKHRSDWLGSLAEHLPGLPGASVTVQNVTLPPPPAGMGPVSYAQAVRHAAPAVVNIYTSETLHAPANPFFSDPLFSHFFRLQPRTEQRHGLGSGVIVSAAGYLLTNNHVIDGADKITIALADGREVAADVVGSDPDTDIAVLRIHLDHLPVANLRLQQPVQVGDVVLAIGNPFGFSQSVTQGIVSALGRQGLGINTYEDFIQTDAAINPGNSGGALVDAYGNVVGINSAIYSQSGGSMGIGFAIPIALAKNVMSDIIKDGRVIRGWLGIELSAPANDEMPAATPATQAVVVAAVLQGGPAAEAGIQAGDQLISIDGRALHSDSEAMRRIAELRPGSVALFTLHRHQQTWQARVRIGERPRQQQSVQDNTQP